MKEKIEKVILESQMVAGSVQASVIAEKLIWNGIGFLGDEEERKDIRCRHCEFYVPIKAVNPRSKLSEDTKICIWYNRFESPDGYCYHAERKEKRDERSAEAGESQIQRED